MIGEVFEVDNYEWSDEWYAVEKQKEHGCSLYCILKQDCEEVTMEKFKVGDKVKILSDTSRKLSEYTGTIQEISSIEGLWYYMKGLPREKNKSDYAQDNIVWTEDELELVPNETPKKTMNLKEALKAMLDGKTVVISEKQWDGYKFSYSDTFNHFVVSFRGDTIEATALKYYCNKQFKLYSPPHKYSKGQFIVSTSGDFGKIIETDGHDNGVPKYKLQFTSGEKTLVYTEDKIGGLA